MNVLTKSTIPEVDIRRYQKGDSNLLVLSLEELCGKYESVITKPHRINYYQLVLIVDGKGKIKIDSHEYCLNSRSFFTVSKGQVEVLEFDLNTIGYVVLFSADYMCRYPEDMKWINSLKLFNPLTQYFADGLPRLEYLELLDIIFQIDIELKTGNSFASEEIIFNLIKILMIKYERMNCPGTVFERKEDGDASYIARFRETLEEHFIHSRMVSYYADFLSITSKKLNQITSACCGKPAKQLIEDRVMLEIKRLLVYTDQTVKEIGFSLGFADPTNFNKYFKKYASTTPSEFREMNKRAH